MVPNDEEFLNEDNNHSEQQENNKPNAYRVDDDDNLTEDDLQHGFPASKNDMKKQDAPGMEGHGMGGQNFGENNLTPSGDDEANPSQTAGYTNEYFRRTQPAQEHPENNNFKDPDQLGQPNYIAASAASPDTRPDEGDDGDTNVCDHDQQTARQTYQEGTADNDGNNHKKHDNIPGPNEIPD